MPATFEEYGVRFLYPDNWEIAERSADDESVGVTIESPGGAFFSLHRYRNQSLPDHLLRQAADAMREEYEELESESYEDPDALPGESGSELRFYYLDLLITARILVIPDADDLLLVQMQGENRDFDQQARVFDAMLKTLRESLRR